MGTSCVILLVFQFQRRKGSIAPPRGPPKVISSFGCDSERSSKRMDSEKPEQIRTKRAWQSRGARGGGPDQVAVESGETLERRVV